MTSTAKRPALARIYTLAAQHGIVAERMPLDDWADTRSKGLGLSR